MAYKISTQFTIDIRKIKEPSVELILINKSIDYLSSVHGLFDSLVSGHTEKSNLKL